MHNYHRSYFYLKTAIDLFLLAVSFLLASFLAKYRVYPETMFFDLERREIPMLLVLSIIWCFSAQATGLYDEFRSRTFSFELITVVKNCLIQILASVIILFGLKTLFISRYFIVANFLFQVVLLGIAKLALRLILIWVRSQGRNLRFILLVGAGKVGQEFCRTIGTFPHLGYRVTGFLDDQEQPALGNLYLGTLDRLDQVLQQRQVDEVVVALPNEARDSIGKVLFTCEQYPTQVRIIPNFFSWLSPRFHVSIFGNFPIISVRNNPLDELHWRFLKRFCDLAVSLFLFIFVFSWLWPLIAAAVKLSSPGPVLFKQERWGRKNKRIICYKFRTMYHECNDVDENGHFVQATKSDPRVTRVGRLLRKASLDEIPQFLNVLKGEMSIVGPRPHPTPINLESKDNIRRYMLRHLVKSGITGWAQVNGCRGVTDKPELMQRRIDYDIWYIENWSFWLDMQILFYTLRDIITKNPNAY